MSAHDIFVVFIALHITTGAPGLIGFWVPVAAKKGGNLHRISGRFFAIAMLITATAAMCMSTMSLIWPMETHPHLAHHEEFSDPVLVRGIFGWMMLYLAILTINLAWYGWRAAVNKLDHAKNRDWINWVLQAVLFIASAQCAIEGVRIGQPMMIGISMVGFATVATNLWFLLKTKPSPIDWLLEHIKAIVGTGISVYTAFFAFGAVRLMPELALAPVLWAIPLLVGLGLIFYHRWQVSRRFNARKRAVQKSRDGLDPTTAG
jgi:hypothetical protein